MRSILSVCTVALALAVTPFVGGCEVSDNVLNIDDPKVNFDTDVDVDNVEEGQAVTVHVDVEDSVMVAPDAEPPEGQAEAAVYVQIHLDDVESEPLLITAEATATVNIPVGTPPGKHELICRVHKHADGSPTGQESRIEINVVASASTE